MSTVVPVSVIVPTYNRAGYLPISLGSVIGQTAECLEMIVVDDGSTDQTEAVVARLARHATVPIRYCVTAHGGVAAARNHGIESARGRYLAFLDSDDSWHPGKLARQYALMVENPAFMVSHTREKWLRRGKHLNQKKKHLPRQGDIFIQCLQLCAVGMSTVMVKKELFSKVGLFDEGYPCCEDYELWLRVSARYPFLLVDEQLTIKNGGRDDQLSQRYRIGMDRFRIQALEKLLASGGLASAQTMAAQRQLMKKLSIYGNGCIRHGRQDEGRSCLDRAADLNRHCRDD